MPQKNKPFKGSSKGKHKGGRVETKRTAIKAVSGFGKPGSSSKQQRQHAKHLQRQKRNELLREKRIGTRNGPPTIVVSSERSLARVVEFVHVHLIAFFFA